MSFGRTIALNHVESSGIVGKNFPFDLRASIQASNGSSRSNSSICFEAEELAARAPDEVVGKSGDYSDQSKLQCTANGFKNRREDG
jgi:hypothetical protein